MNISLVVSTRDNLKYLKWSYNSIRKNQGNHEVWICYGIDHCTDGTQDWIEEIKKTDPFVRSIENTTGERVGHTIMYDRIINEIVDTDLAMIFHSDMYLCPGALDAIERLMYSQPDRSQNPHQPYIPLIITNPDGSRNFAPKKNRIVSLTRIEPPLHPAGPEKIVMDFGTEPENFDETGLLDYYVKHINFSKTSGQNKTNGVFAPWCFWVDEFKEIGGHDSLYAPQSKEDCVKYDTLIFVEINGYKQYITINELWNKYSNLSKIRKDGNFTVDLSKENIKVLSPKQNGNFSFEQLKGLVKKSVQSNRLYDIRTNWGQVTVTDDHSLIDSDCNAIKVSEIEQSNDLWKPKRFNVDCMRRNLLKSVRIKDTVIDNIDEYGKNTTLLDICEFLGFFVAEGSVTFNTNLICICQNNLDILNYMKNKSKSLFGDNFWGKLTIDGNKSQTKPMYIYRKTNSKWGIYLKELVGINSEYKKVPDFIYNIPKVYQEAFLYGYLVGDGYLGTNINRQNNIEFLSVDKRLFFKNNVFKEFQWKSTSKSAILTTGINLLIRRCFPDTLTTIFFAKDKGSKGVFNLTTLTKDYKKSILDITPHTNVQEDDVVVFDLEVRNTHTFIGGVGLVGLHNSDIFNRFKLTNCEFIQTWNGYVYHLTSRGSRFNPNLTTVGQNSSEWEKQNLRSTKNFIRKWGSLVLHDEYLHPIVAPRYKTTFVIENCYYNLLAHLEPWCDYLDCGWANEKIDFYIEQEQPNTKFDLSLKFYGKPDKEGIVVHINGHYFNDDDYKYITQLSQIIEQNEELGEFRLGNLKINILDLTHYERDLIVCSND